ncbi:hypothetical protein JCM17961_10590 [Endothiovibrio diazotrophicus]
MRTVSQLSVGGINPLVDPDDPVETMGRVAAVLTLLHDALEDRELEGPIPPGYLLTLRCATAALELPLDIGRDDGTLPPVETRP